MRRIPATTDVIPNKENERENKLVVSPNPTYDGHVTLRIEDLSSADPAKVEVTDAQGALVRAQWSPTTADSVLGTIDLGADLPTGVYLVTVTVKDQRFTQRLVKY